jgi:hypothetical protein
MDEAAGATTLTDSSGYGRHATLGTGVTIVDSRFGKAARFDGTAAAWARFTSQIYLTNFTLSVWFNVPQGYTNTVYPKLINFNNMYYQFSWMSPKRFNIGLGATGTGNSRAEWTSTDQAPFTFDTNRWYHAALVIQRTYTNATDWAAQPVFYLNGVRCGLDAQAAKSYSPDTIGTAAYGFLGNTDVNGTRALTGDLDEVRIYDAALTDSEILSLYQNLPVTADAGSDQTVFRDSTPLQGRVFSDNPFTRRFAATSLWSVASAPSGASPVIAAPDMPATSASLPEPGIYVFQLTAFSDFGVVTDTVSVTRLAVEPLVNAAPSVIPLWNVTNTVLGAAAPLAATVTDDGIPGPVRLRWRKVSGPGAVFFDNPYTNATAALFSTNGTYVVRLEAADGAASNTADITVAVALPSTDLTNGLIYWWQMDDNPTLKKAYDSVGGNTLTLLHQAFLQPGKTGLGLRTTKSDSSAHAAAVLPNDVFLTFTAWFYHDNAYTNNPYMRFFNCGPNFYIIYNRLENRLELSTRGIGTGDTQFTWAWPSFSPTSNRWFHVAVLFDRRSAVSGMRQIMYINGVRHLSNSLSMAFPGGADFTSPFVLGNTQPSGGNRNFDGVLDEARVYNRFITDEEALLLAADPDNNHAPVIEAPETATVKTGLPVSGLAAVFDDGQPADGALVTRWTVVSGDPPRVQFADPDDPATAVTFTRTGDYVLRLDATDGERRSAALLHVTAHSSGTLISIQ